MSFKDILSKVGLAGAVAAASEYARHHTKQYLDRQAAKQATITTNNEDGGLDDETGEPTVKRTPPDPFAYAKRKLSGALSGLRGNGVKRDSTIDAFKRAHKKDPDDQELPGTDEGVEETP